MADAKWLKLGLIKKSDKGTQYLQLGTPKSKYEPVNVELVVKDLNGKVLASVTNPSINVNNPRKRPGITETQLASIPDYIMAELTLPPPKKA